MKKILSCFFGFIVFVSAAFADRSKITVLYTNDVHTHISNTVKDASGNRVPGLTYASVSAMKKELEASGEKVILVDNGDFSQGTIYGAEDQGATIISLMNAAGYDAATLGNHDFDFGMATTMKFIKKAKFPIVSCNFFKGKKPVTKPYAIIRRGNVKVALIGIATPETLTKSSPVNFMDKKKSKVIYNFAEDNTGDRLAKTIQNAIDEARPKADYVIAIGHLGIDESAAPFRSTDIIPKLSGLDAFLDGHSHSLVEQQFVKDRNGNDVLLTQTGCYLANIGRMTLDGNKVESKLVSGYEGKDLAVDAIAKSFIEKTDSKLKKVFAVNENKLVMRTDDDSEWFVRKHETNLGDFTADAYYWYINEVEKMQCDMVFINAGGIRENIPAGDANYITVKNVAPFGNQTCLIQMDGQSILDVLEFGARGAGVESIGGFMQVAGLKYSVDTSIPSTVKYNEKRMWTEGPSEYRVHDVEIYSKEKGTYEPLDLNRKYSIGGQSFLIRNCGDGFSMFGNALLIKDYIGEDYIILAEYSKAFGGKDSKGLPHMNSKNSPLSAYSAYMLNYENPDGSGRILIK